MECSTKFSLPDRISGQNVPDQSRFWTESPRVGRNSPICNLFIRRIRRGEWGWGLASRGLVGETDELIGWTNRLVDRLLVERAGGRARGRASVQMGGRTGDRKCGLADWREGGKRAGGRADGGPKGGVAIGRTDRIDVATTAAWRTTATNKAQLYKIQFTEQKYENLTYQYVPHL